MTSPSGKLTRNMTSLLQPGKFITVSRQACTWCSFRVGLLYPGTYCILFEDSQQGFLSLLSVVRVIIFPSHNFFYLQGDLQLVQPGLWKSHAVWCQPSRGRVPLLNPWTRLQFQVYNLFSVQNPVPNLATSLDLISVKVKFIFRMYIPAKPAKYGMLHKD